MADEICIPTDRVPVDILNKLKEIGLLFQSESIPPRSLSSSLSLSALPSSSFPSTSSQKEHDECDNLTASTSHSDSVVHVLNPAVTSQHTTHVQRGSDIVSVFATRPSPFTDSQNSLNPAVTSQERTHAQQDDDVVSVFATRPPKDAASQSAAWQSQSSSSQQLSQLHPSSLLSVPVPCSQSSQQYLTPSYPNYADVPDYSGASSPNPHPPSPLKSLSCPEVEEERRLLHNRSPTKTSGKQRSSSLEHSQSPSVSEASNASATSSASSQLARSRSPPSQQSSSSDDNVVRVFPPRPATPSADVGQRSPKMLTPPETPESEGKRVVPEVFTFDDLTCTQERFRQTYEVRGV